MSQSWRTSILPILVVTLAYFLHAYWQEFSFFLHNPFNDYDLSNLRDLSCIQLAYPDMIFKWLSCPPKDAIIRYYENTDEPMSECVFCDILHGTSSSRTVYQDDKYIAFHDINPSAQVHLLIIPKVHIETVRNLTHLDIELVQDMHRIGKSLLQELNIPPHQQRFGFHVPPFTSVPHLHLHAIGMPFTNWVRALKYPSDSWTWARWWISYDRFTASLHYASMHAQLPQHSKWDWTWVKAADRIHKMHTSTS